MMGSSFLASKFPFLAKKTNKMFSVKKKIVMKNEAKRENKDREVQWSLESP
jgi:hypothetical protein